MIDTLGEHERFGVERLKRLLAEHAGEPPDELLSELEAGLDRFQVGAQADDTAALALRPAAVARRRGARGGASGGPFSYPSGHLTEGGPVGSQPNFRIETLESQFGTTIKLAGELDSATIDAAARDGSSGRSRRSTGASS